MNVDSNWGLTLLIFLYPNPPRHVIAASFPFETQVETQLPNSLDLFTINLTHSPLRLRTVLVYNSKSRCKIFFIFS